jgi:hypothetical protein
MLKCNVPGVQDSIKKTKHLNNIIITLDILDKESACPVSWLLTEHASQPLADS